MVVESVIHDLTVRVEVEADGSNRAVPCGGRGFRGLRFCFLENGVGRADWRAGERWRFVMAPVLNYGTLICGQMGDVFYTLRERG